MSAPRRGPAPPAASGFGLLCLADRFRSLELVPGVDLVAEETGLDAKLARADVVVTGEGRIDAQTAFGKTALGVARRAQAAGVRCIAVGGGVEPEGAAALAALGVRGRRRPRGRRSRSRRRSRRVPRRCRLRRAARPIDH